MPAAFLGPKMLKKSTRTPVAKTFPHLDEATSGIGELSVHESSDSDDDGVDEEGMAHLMKALGDDGLGEFELAQLDVLGSESDEDDEGGEEDAGEEDAGEEDAEGEVGSDEEDAADLAEEDDEDEFEDAEGVPLDEAESIDDDAVPRQKIEIDNKVALERIRDTIKLDPSLPWTETLTASYPNVIDVDVEDDLNREIAFYKQALHAAISAKSLAAKHNLPFTRPSDYFAEMVKSDSHMERIRQRLLDEGATIKRSEQKRKEREGKKFGKQVQIEKAKERERGKKEMDERLKGLKRKRKGALDNAQADDDAFDVAVEDAISDRPAKRAKGSAPEGKSKLPRHARDRKFGFGGGEGRRAKQNTKASTDDFGGGGADRGRRGKGGPPHGGRKGGKPSGGPKRLGKTRRMTTKSKS